MLGLHNAKIGQRTKTLICHLANGCGFTQSTKLFGTFWHQLKSTKIVKIDKNCLARFGIKLSSVHFHILGKGQNHSIYHIAKGLGFRVPWILVKGYILHNPFGQRPRSTQHDVKVNLISKLYWNYRTSWLREKNFRLIQVSMMSILKIL